ncbi:phage tail spike protein [Lacticaseibacillus paracasei]|uniref:PblB n=1 Tax=Lacticaseibacillus paracasei N1115 TaxID=1446494 RepID=A0A806L897_LACPA|nr:phage tail spike protein [Lacticaseibacillus paracasei]AHJ33416.1 PblB [Lacticaseibacillus paracasei N1115]
MSTDIELYPRDQTDFSHHGYALDDISNDIVTWQLNAKFTLTFDYPMFSEHAGELVAENIVRVPVPGGKAAFRIAQVIKSMGHLSITAYHVFWDLNDDFIADTNIVDKDGQGALDQIMRAANYPTGFKVLSTIGNVTNARLVRMSIIKALLGTDDNSFLNRWGGEFDWQDFSFSVNPRLGKDRGVHFEYAHNLTGYEATKDSSGIITRLLPEGYNGLLLPELYVDSPKLGNYRKPKIGTKTYQDIKAIDETQATGDQEGAVPVQEAYELLRAAAAKEFFESHIDEAQWTYKLNVALLENTEEYKDLSITTTVLPGDTVTITHKLDGIDVRARLTGYTWQPSNHSYLTQTYDSASRPDVAYSNLSSRVNEIKSQIELVDKVVIAKAANGMNSTGWGDQSPVDLNIAGKTGDVYYQTTAKGTIMWLFHDGQWNAETGDAFGTEVQKKVDTAIEDVAAAKQAANDAVAKASAAVSSSGLATTTANAASDAASAAKQLATEVSNNFATVKAQATTAASDAATALINAKSALATANGVSGDYTSLKQIVDDTTATVSTLATQTSVDAVNQTVTTTKSLAEQTANGLTLKADSSTVDTLSDTVKQQGIDLEAAQGELKLKLTQSDLTKGLDGYATQTWAQNQINASATELSSTMTTVQTQVQNSAVGTNLISGSYDSSWGFNINGINVTIQKVTMDSGEVALHVISTDGGGFWYHPNLPSGIGIYTISVDVKGTGIVNGLGWEGLSAESAYPTNDWQRVSRTASINSNNWYAFIFYGKMDVYVKLLKVEKGNLATDWCPNPADNASVTALSQLSQTVDGLTATFATKNDLATTTTQVKATASGLSAITAVTGTKGENVTQVIADVNNIKTTMTGTNGVTASLQTLKGFQNTATNQISGLQSQQTQLSDQITTIIESRDNIVRKAWFDDSKVGGWAGSIFTTDDTITVTGHKNYLKLSARDNIEHGNDFTVSSNEVYYIDAWVNTYNTKYPVLIGLYIITGDGGWAWVPAASMDPNHGLIHISGNVTIPDKGRSAIPWIQIDGTAGSDLGFALVLGMRITRNAGSSQITQLQDAINLRVSKGDVLSQINLEANRTLIQSGKLVLDAPTVVFTGNAFIPSAAIASLSADKITTGTLNAANLNVINLNASSIVTGTISGANLAINLNTGMVEFQKGRIHSTDNNIDINIDQKYISVTDSNNSVLLKGGSMTFTQPYAFDTDQTPYLTIDNVGSSQTLGRGAEIVGRDVLTVSVSGENNSFLSGVPLFQKDFSGISISKNYDTVVGGANRGVRIIGGGSYSTGLGMSTVPSIMVGYNDGAVTGKGSGGTRINIEADYVHIPSAWSKTTSSSPNAFVASDGALVRSTSASKYKVNIKRDRSTELAEQLLTLPTAHWLDKAAMERYASGEQKELPQTNFGLIAEDLEAAGLEDLVVRGPDGELEGIQYDRIAAALLPLLAQMKTEIDELKATA